MRYSQLRHRVPYTMLFLEYILWMSKIPQKYVYLAKFSKLLHVFSKVISLHRNVLRNLVNFTRKWESNGPWPCGKDYLCSWQIRGLMCFVFLSFLPLLPQATTGLIRSYLSSLCSYTVSPALACLPIWLERFRRNQKEDAHGPLIVQSSLMTTQEKLSHGQILHVSWNEAVNRNVICSFKCFVPGKQTLGSPGAIAIEFTCLPMVLSELM